MRGEAKSSPLEMPFKQSAAMWGDGSFNSQLRIQQYSVESTIPTQPNLVPFAGSLRVIVEQFLSLSPSMFREEDKSVQLRQSDVKKRMVIPILKNDAYDTRRLGQPPSQFVNVRGCLSSNAEKKRGHVVMFEQKRGHVVMFAIDMI